MRAIELSHTTCKDEFIDRMLDLTAVVLLILINNNNNIVFFSPIGLVAPFHHFLGASEG